MRILMTADTVGGVWTYAVELARGLAAFDCEVALAAVGSRLTPDQKIDVAALPNTSVFELPGRLEWMDDPWDDVAASCHELRRIARDFAPDVIHANTFAHAALDWGAPVLLAAHSCVVSWFAEVRGEEPPPGFDRYRATVRTALDSADLVVAPTAAMREFLCRGYGPIGESAVIPNGISASSEPADFEMLFPGKRPSVFAAGRMWDEAKNLAVVATAATATSATVRVASLPHPDGNDAQDDRVEYLGRLDRARMEQEFERASVFVHPAKYEPFGLTPLEAASRACALVLGDIATLREVWGDAALFVAPDDADAVARSVDRLLEDRTLRRDLAHRAFRLAGTLTAERMASAYYERYVRLLARRPLEVR